MYEVQYDSSTRVVIQDILGLTSLQCPLCKVLQARSYQPCTPKEIMLGSHGSEGTTMTRTTSLPTMVDMVISTMTAMWVPLDPILSTVPCIPKEI